MSKKNNVKNLNNEICYKPSRKNYPTNRIIIIQIHEIWSIDS